jgi:hypothetical protein
MAVLAAANLAAMLREYPAWNRAGVTPFLQETMPEAAPSIVNAQDLGLEIFAD